MKSLDHTVVPAALCLSLFLTLAPRPAEAAGAGWFPLGPTMGQPVPSIVVRPGAPSQLFAGADSGLFRTLTGEHWESLSRHDLPLGATGRLCAGATPGSPVYLRTPRSPDRLGGRLYRSDDGGESWRLIDDDPGAALLAVAASDPSRLYLASGTTLLVSDDAGETWAPAAPYPFGDLGAALDSAGVAVAASDPATTYLLFVFDTNGPGERPALWLLRTTDGGEHWVQTDGPNLGGHHTVDLVVDKADPDTVYLALTSGVYRSVDGGATWTVGKQGLPVAQTGVQAGRIPLRDLALDPQVPSTLYAALEPVAGEDPGGVFRSTDGGATWAPARQGLPLPLAVFDLAPDSTHPGVLYAGTPRGVFRSADGGDHWAATPAELPTPTSSVAIDPASPRTVYSGAADRGGLSVSHDGGDTWAPTGEGLPISSGGSLLVTQVATGDPSVLYASNGGVIWRSHDAGQTFVQADTSGPLGHIMEVLIDPRDPAVIYAADGASHPAGVYRSFDGGDSWTRTLNGPVEALAQAPSDPDVLYAGARAHSPPSPFAIGVCRSGDAGESWGCSVSGLTPGYQVTALAVDPRDADTVVAALVRDFFTAPIDSRIRRSVDGGATWGPIASGLPVGTPVTDLVFDPARPGTVWASTRHAGVFRSADGGASWTPENQGLTHLQVHDLALDPASGSLLAATEAGVFRYSTASGPAPPPEVPWIDDTAFPDFWLKVRIDQGGGHALAGTREGTCIPETICVSGAVPGRAEVFVRVVGPKPNSRLWPTLVKFSTSRIEIWILQRSTGELRYYELRGASPGFDELPGLFDRQGFVPQ